MSDKYKCEENTDLIDQVDLVRVRDSYLVGYLFKDTADEVLRDLNKVAEGEQGKNVSSIPADEVSLAQFDYDEQFNGGVK